MSESPTSHPTISEYNILWPQQLYDQSILDGTSLPLLLLATAVSTSRYETRPRDANTHRTVAEGDQTPSVYF